MGYLRYDFEKGKQNFKLTVDSGWLTLQEVDRHAGRLFLFVFHPFIFQKHALSDETITTFHPPIRPLIYLSLHPYNHWLAQRPTLTIYLSVQSAHTYTQDIGKCNKRRQRDKQMARGVCLRRLFNRKTWEFSVWTSSESAHGETSASEKEQAMLFQFLVTV